MSAGSAAQEDGEFGVRTGTAASPGAEVEPGGDAQPALADQTLDESEVTERQYREEDDHNQRHRHRHGLAPVEKLLNPSPPELALASAPHVGETTTESNRLTPPQRSLPLLPPTSDEARPTSDAEDVMPPPAGIASCPSPTAGVAQVPSTGNSPASSRQRNDSGPTTLQLNQTTHSPPSGDALDAGEVSGRQPVIVVVGEIAADPAHNFASNTGNGTFDDHLNQYDDPDPVVEVIMPEISTGSTPGEIGTLQHAHGDNDSELVNSPTIPPSDSAAARYRRKSGDALDPDLMAVTPETFDVNEESTSEVAVDDDFREKKPDTDLRPPEDTNSRQSDGVPPAEADMEIENSALPLSDQKLPTLDEQPPLPQDHDVVDDEFGEQETEASTNPLNTKPIKQSDADSNVVPINIIPTAGSDGDKMQYEQQSDCDEISEEGSKGDMGSNDLIAIEPIPKQARQPISSPVPNQNNDVSVFVEEDAMKATSTSQSAIDSEGTKVEIEPKNVKSDTVKPSLSEQGKASDPEPARSSVGGAAELSPKQLEAKPHGFYDVEQHSSKDSKTKDDLPAPELGSGEMGSVSGAPTQPTSAAMSLASPVNQSASGSAGSFTVPQAHPDDPSSAAAPLVASKKVGSGPVVPSRKTSEVETEGAIVPPEGAVPTTSKMNVVLPDEPTPELPDAETSGANTRVPTGEITKTASEAETKPDRQQPSSMDSIDLRHPLPVPPTLEVVPVLSGSTPVLPSGLPTVPENARTDKMTSANTELAPKTEVASLFPAGNTSLTSPSVAAGTPAMMFGLPTTNLPRTPGFASSNPVSFASSSPFSFHSFEGHNKKQDAEKEAVARLTDAESPNVSAANPHYAIEHEASGQENSKTLSKAAVQKPDEPNKAAGQSQTSNLSVQSPQKDLLALALPRASHASPPQKDSGIGSLQLPDKSETADKIDQVLPGPKKVTFAKKKFPKASPPTTSNLLESSGAAVLESKARVTLLHLKGNPIQSEENAASQRWYSFIMYRSRASCKDLTVVLQFYPEESDTTVEPEAVVGFVTKTTTKQIPKSPKSVMVVQSESEQFTNKFVMQFKDTHGLDEFLSHLNPVKPPPLSAIRARLRQRLGITSTAKESGKTESLPDASPAQLNINAKEFVPKGIVAAPQVETQPDSTNEEAPDAETASPIAPPSSSASDSLSKQPTRPGITPSIPVSTLQSASKENNAIESVSSPGPDLQSAPGGPAQATPEIALQTISEAPAQALPVKPSESSSKPFPQTPSSVTPLAVAIPQLKGAADMRAPATKLSMSVDDSAKGDQAKVSAMEIDEPMAHLDNQKLVPQAALTQAEELRKTRVELGLVEADKNSARKECASLMLQIAEHENAIRQAHAANIQAIEKEQEESRCRLMAHGNRLAASIVHMKERLQQHGGSTSSLVSEDIQLGHRPFNVDDYRCRMRTFSPVGWPGKEKVIDAVECARRGWLNSGINKLRSEDGAEIMFDDRATNRSAEVERVRKLLCGLGHMQGSGWVVTPCPPGFRDLPIEDSSEVRNTIDSIVQQLIAINPSIVLHSSSQIRLEEAKRVLSEAGVCQPGEYEDHMKFYLIAISGWKPVTRSIGLTSKSRNRDDIYLICRFCHVELFLPDLEAEEVFHTFDEHRVFCPIDVGDGWKQQLAAFRVVTGRGTKRGRSSEDADTDEPPASSPRNNAGVGV